MRSSGKRIPSSTADDSLPLLQPLPLLPLALPRPPPNDLRLPAGVANASSISSSSSSRQL